MHLAERTAEHGRVLREHPDGSAVHSRAARDHAIAGRAPVGHPERRRPVHAAAAELLERAGVDKQVQALACGQRQQGQQLLLGALGRQQCGRSGDV
jgi:hypothetical protein